MARAFKSQGERDGAKRNNGLWCGCVGRTGKVFDEQTRNNGVDKVRAMRRRG